MARFDECLSSILRSEGGYVNNPNDPGGATNKGITQKVYDEYRRTAGRIPQPVMLITDAEVADIYKRQYWNPCKCDVLPKGVDLLVFDAAVNTGVKQAAKFLQRALGVDDDGSIGPATIQALTNDVKNGMTADIIENLLSQRRSFYLEIIENKPSLSVFKKGWLARADRLTTEVA